MTGDEPPVPGSLWERVLNERRRRGLTGREGESPVKGNAQAGEGSGARATGPEVPASGNYAAQESSAGAAGAGAAGGRNIKYMPVRREGERERKENPAHAFRDHGASEDGASASGGSSGAEAGYGHKTIMMPARPHGASEKPGKPKHKRRAGMLATAALIGTSLAGLFVYNNYPGIIGRYSGEEGRERTAQVDRQKPVTGQRQTGQHARERTREETHGERPAPERPYAGPASSVLPGSIKWDFEPDPNKWNVLPAADLSIRTDAGGKNYVRISQKRAAGSGGVDYVGVRLGEKGGKWSDWVYAGADKGVSKFAFPLPGTGRFSYQIAGLESDGDNDGRFRVTVSYAGTANGAPASAAAGYNSNFVKGQLAKLAGAYE